MTATAFAIPDVDPPPPPSATGPKPASTPEPSEALRVEGDGAAQRALAILAIADDATEVLADELLGALKDLDQKIEADHRPGIKSAFDHHRLLCARMDKWRAPVLKAIAHLRPMLARRLDDKRRAEEARQREEREKAQAAERERLLAEAVHAEKTGESKEVVQTLFQEAETVAPPPVAARPITEVKGVSTRANWKGEVVDKVRLVQFVAANPNFIDLLEVNQTKLNELARSLNARLASTVAGVRAVNEPILTKRNAR